VTDRNPNQSPLGYGPGSPSAMARERRMTEFLQRFPHIELMSVIDLGGVPDFWLKAPRHPRELVCVNLDSRITVPVSQGGHDPNLDWIRCVQADACAFRGVHADLVVSNSLIEHVGGVGPREALARTVQILGAAYWVQTPYRYFPVEPHWMFPGMQFLPLRARQVVARRHWSVGTKYSREYADREATWTELIGKTELRQLFPDAQIWEERLLGLTKSIVAVRVAGEAESRDTAVPRRDVNPH